MVIMNEVKIKYSHLDSLLDEKLQDIRFTNSVNVIVDLKEIFRKLFRPEIMQENRPKKASIEEVSSDILNLIAHYRNYFFKHGKYSSFYFLYSKSEADLIKKDHPEYKKEFYEKYFYSVEDQEKIDIIKKVIQVLEKIIPNVPNCNFIDTSKYDDVVFAKFIKDQTLANQLNIILTNDEAYLQLLNSHTFIIDIKGINAELLDEKNGLAKFSKCKTELSTNLIPLVLSLGGSKHYGLEKIPGIATIKAIRMVEDLIKNKKIIDTPYIDFPLDVTNLSDKNKNEKLIKDNYEMLKKTYGVYTGNTLLYSNKTDIATFFNKVKSVRTWDYFLELNSKIFVNFPLMLEMMMKGETLK